MKSLIPLLFLASTALAEPCNLPAKNTPTGGRNWRVVGVLWKPIGEHTGKPVVVTLPRGRYERVTIYDLRGRRGRNIPFFSVGDAGDAWREPKFTAKELRAKYRSLLVRLKVRGKNSCKWIKVSNPEKRSDG